MSIRDDFEKHFSGVYGMAKDSLNQYVAADTAAAWDGFQVGQAAASEEVEPMASEEMKMRALVEGLQALASQGKSGAIRHTSEREHFLMNEAYKAGQKDGGLEPMGDWLDTTVDDFGLSVYDDLVKRASHFNEQPESAEVDLACAYCGGAERVAAKMPEALILRKQAEAVEAANDSLRNEINDIPGSILSTKESHLLSRALRHIEQYAQRLRQQAAELEKAGGDDETAT